MKKKKLKRKVGKKTKKVTKSNLLIGLLVILSIVYLINIFNLNQLSKTMDEKIADIEEVARPSNLEITKIVSSSCTDCFDIDSVVDTINQQNIKITKEDVLEFNSPEAEQLINQYGILTIPSLIIKGEISKSEELFSFLNQIGYQKEENVLVYMNADLPYYDLLKKEVVGRVTTIILTDSSCTDCTDMNNIVNSFKQIGVKIVDEKTVEYDSSEGKELIEKYNVQKIPALILSKDITEYPQVQQIWDQLNATEKEGSYALHTLSPPYRDVSSNKIVGLVDVIYLTDNSCSECYDVSIHKQIIQGFGVSITNEETYDITSSKGKELITKYNITKVPTVILSPETSVYSPLTQIWVQVGTIEKDGWYVFKDETFMQQAGGYKDLLSG